MEGNGNMAGLCFKDGCFITVRIQTLLSRSVFVGETIGPVRRKSDPTLALYYCAITTREFVGTK